MIHFRSRTGRRPHHARPSILAPTRTVAVAAGLGVVTAAIVAGCAAAAGGEAGPAGAAKSAAPRPASIPALGTMAAGMPVVHRFGAGDFGLGGTVTGTAPSDPAIVGSGVAGAPDAAPVSGLAASGIPSTALAAYRRAATREAALRPSCGLTWPLLAGIGRVESNHGRFAGAVLHADGVSTPRIIGIPLNGHGTALITDTDHGRLDGDLVYDRAVGPMQFIPSTWAGWGVDANGDGVADPFNIFDAAAAAPDYLCAAGTDLTTSAGQVQAILTYNYSAEYVSLVMGLEKVYAAQVGLAVPVLATPPATKNLPKPTLPPADPGRPSGLKEQPTSTAGASSTAGSSKPPVKGSSSSSASSGSSSSGGSGGSSGASSSTAPSSPAGTSSSAGSSGPKPGPTSSSSTPAPSETTCPTPTGSATASSTTPDPSASPDPCASPSESPSAGGAAVSDGSGAASS
jgi:uncharacterized membrane protein YgcG